MEFAIQPKNKTFGEVLSSNKISVPPYQRPFVWKDKQIKPFIKSVIDMTEKNLGATKARDKKFIGPIVFHRTSRAGSRSDLIDGQQRLTTLLLLLFAIKQSVETNALRLEFSERDVDGVLEKMKASIPVVFPGVNAENFRVNSHIAVVVDKLLRIPTQRVASNNNLWTEAVKANPRVALLRTSYNAVYAQFEKYLVENIATLAKVSQRKAHYTQFVEMLLKTVSILEISTPNEVDAMGLFESLNRGGSPLGASDLVKANIFQAFTRKGSTDANAIEDPQAFDERWKGIEKTIDASGSDFATFMFQWMLGRPEIDVRSYEDITKSFQKLVEIRAGINEEARMRGVMKDMSEAADFYREIALSRTNSPVVNAHLLRSSFLGDAYRIMALRLCVWAKTAIPDGGKWPKEIIDLVKTLENVYFRMAFTNQLPQKMSDVIRNSARMLTGEYSTATLRSVKNHLIEQTRKLSVDDAAIKRRFEDIPGKSGHRYYVLFREAFDGMDAKMAEYVIPEIKFQIEHIIPVKWENNWPKSAFPSGDLANRYVQNWGNLCLLDKHTNNAIKDKSWVAKRDGGTDPRDPSKRLPCYKSAEPQWVRDNLSSKSDWNYRHIDARRKKLVAMIIRATAL